MTAWYTRNDSPSDDTKHALGEFDKEPNTVEGSKVGIHATFVKAETFLELILASSEIPPLPGRESGDIEETFHKINSEQKFSLEGPVGAYVIL